VGDLVKTDDDEGVSIDVAETGHDTAPDRGFHAENSGIVRGIGGVPFGVVLEAFETRSGMKADAALGPFLKFCEDVFGDKDDVRGAADELVFGSFGLGNDESENRGAVGRRDGDKAFAGLEFGVVGEVKAELVHEKTDAAVVVADEDVDALDAEVGGRRS